MALPVGLFVIGEDEVCKSDRMHYLDGLRGVAILLVVVFHAYARWPAYVPWATRHSEVLFVKYGAMGVDLFFMISGYVIFMTLEKCQSFGQFLYRRWLRLFPAMLVATLALYCSSGLFLDGPADSHQYFDVLPGLLFIEPWVLSKLLGVHFVGLSGAFWSIYVEVKFYVIFGLMYFSLGRRSLWALIGLFLIGVAIELLRGIGWRLSPTVLEKILFDLFSMKYYGWFCVGALIYLAKQTGHPAYCFASLLLLPLSVYMGRGVDFGAAVFGVGIYCSFVAATNSRVVQKIFAFGPLVFLGFVSYPLYLLHENALIAMTMAFYRTFPDFPPLLTPFPGFVVIVAVSFFVAKIVEPRVKALLVRGGAKFSLVA